jgi:hypothetical protein
MDELKSVFIFGVELIDQLFQLDFDPRFVGMHIQDGHAAHFPSR